MSRRLRKIVSLTFIFVAAGALVIVNSPWVQATVSTSYQIASPRTSSGMYYGLGARVDTARSTSGDGRYVVFSSEASSLVASDTNNLNDIFVRDVANGTTELASVATDGTQSDGYSQQGSISYDGRYVVFTSKASNLYPGITGTSTSHIYIRDLITKTTTLVDATGAGMVGNSYAYTPKVSADGRFVVFMSHANNLVSGYSIPNFDQIYIKDMSNNSIKLLSANSTNSGGNKDSEAPDIDCGGNVITFVTQATNLGAVGSPNGRFDLLISHIGWDKTTLDNVTSTTEYGIIVDGFGLPQLSCDGNKVLFTSASTNVVSPATPSGYINAYQYDRLTKTTTQASISDTGAQANSLQQYKSLNAAMSADGQYVAFTSYASNMDSTVSWGTDTASFMNVYLRDMRRSTTETVTILPTGHRSGWVTDATVSLNANGSRVFFTHHTPNTSNWSRSLISGYTTGGTNGSSDVYWTTTGH